MVLPDGLNDGLYGLSGSNTGSHFTLPGGLAVSLLNLFQRLNF